MSRRSGSRPPADQAIRDALVRRLDTSFAVGAGAGSGKTRVLVDRVIALVDEGRPLERIVAITFTEKAASELRERVRERLADPNGDLPEAAREHRRAAHGMVDAAQLTTIHGFCRSMLSTLPLEAGVTPGFRVLDQLQADLLMERIASEAIEQLRHSGGSRMEAFLLWGGDLAGLKELVGALRRFPDLEPDTPGGEGEAPGPVIAAALDIARRICTQSDAVPPADSLMQQAREIVRLEPILAAPHRSEDEQMRLLRRLQIGKRKGNRDNWEAAGIALSEVRSEWEAVRERRDEAVARYQDRLLAWLIGEAEAVRDAYERRKAELGVLDFDDLLLKTAALLESDSDAASRIAGRYDAFLVDEFQDTDPLQARIVQRLAEATGDIGGDVGGAEPGRGTLFLVGDGSQSIYRFRRADLAVFRKARERLLERGEAAELTVNFRSTPKLVDVANRIFPVLLEEGTCAELQPYREEDAEGAAVSLLDLDPFLDGPAKDRSDGGGEGQAPGRVAMRKAEARALAGWLQERIESGWKVYDRGTCTWRPLRYGDVAVLLRTQTGVPFLEQAFERFGVPYRVSGGRAFFARLEVLETIAVLRAIADPGDEAAVVAALRSPYFGVSDESLVRWAATRRPFTYLDPPDAPVDEAFVSAHLEGEADAPLVEGRRMLAGLHAESMVLSPSGMVRRLYERSRALPLHALKPDGERRMANLLKLLDLAAAYEEAAAGLAEQGEGEPSSLTGLVRFLEEQRQAAAEEESPLVEEEGDAVTLMTIHSAKGLEFPVVALLDRAYAPRFMDTAIPDRERERVVVKAGRLAPSDWEVWREAEKAAQEREARRLLYVAFTRARDHVVLCSSRSDGPVEGTFLAPLESALAAETAHGGGGPEEALVAWVDPRPPQEQPPVPHRLPYTLEEPSGTQVAAALERRRREQIGWEAAIRRAGNPPLTSASRIARIHAAARGEGAAGRGWALLRGSRVHEAMERIARYGERGEEAVAAVVRPEDPPGLAREVADLAASGAALLAEVLAEGWHVAATEWPMLLGERGRIMELTDDEGIEAVTGTADLVLKGSDDSILVVDYKTDSATADALQTRYAMQVHTYRSILSALSGAAVSAEIWSLASGRRIAIP